MREGCDRARGSRRRDRGASRANILLEVVSGRCDGMQVPMLDLETASAVGVAHRDEAGALAVNSKDVDPSRRPAFQEAANPGSSIFPHTAGLCMC